MKSGDFNYNRMVLAASHTFIKDEIEICPSILTLKYGLSIHKHSRYAKYVG